MSELPVNDLSASLAAGPAAEASATLTDPVTAAERISAVDVLRGVALLGILLINILSFGLPYEGKHALLAGAPHDSDTIVWFVVMTLFEGKMRAMFSMLFGGGVILLTERFERRGDPRGADIYYRRTLWLLAIGIVHAYGLWPGDILMSYGVAGLFLYPFRKLSGRSLVLSGLVVLLLGVPGAVYEALRLERLEASAQAAEARQAEGQKLSRRERDDLNDWEDALDDAHPDDETIQASLDAHLGGYWKLFFYRSQYIEEFTAEDFVDTVGMMLVGMGLMKLGVFSARRSTRFYATLVALGLAIGWPLHAWAAGWIYRHDFDPIDLAWIAMTYDPGRLAVALGYVGLVMLVVRLGVARRLTTALGDVGRMALTNYLGTTLVCTTLFYGYGFGLFGQLSCAELYWVVLGVWIVQLLVSPLWLRHFLFGPAEWAWRSLTYWKLQPLVRRSGGAGRVAAHLNTNPTRKRGNIVGGCNANKTPPRPGRGYPRGNIVVGPSLALRVSVRQTDPRGWKARRRRAARTKKGRESCG